MKIKLSCTLWLHLSEAVSPDKVAVAQSTSAIYHEEIEKVAKELTVRVKVGLFI